MEFLQIVLKEIYKAAPNNHSDNWDISRYGNPPKKNLIKQKIKGLLNKLNYYNLNFMDALVSNVTAISKFEYLFNELELEEDKELLIKILAYRILGYTKVKLPLNNSKYWKTLESLKKLSNISDSINPDFLGITLYKINLEKIGFPIELYFTELGIMIDFVIKQYEYNKNGKVIKVEEGDTVIDAGGCWGDTALFFAHEAGRSGKVFTFEFIPKNISIMKKNFSLNNELKKNIEIINKPLWYNSGTKIYFYDYGPASQVSSEPFDGMEDECETINIDDFVLSRKIEKVDFIKMDIEGAETNALKGSVETIKKFKPKLAITLYHSIEDFERIPKLIKEIVPDYNFYFSHCTIHSEESLLFAEVKK